MVALAIVVRRSSSVRVVAGIMITSVRKPSKMKAKFATGAIVMGMLATAVPQAANAQYRERRVERQDRTGNVLLGAGLGLLGGAILSGGDPWATVAGAAAGGAIGGISSNDDRRHLSRRDRDRDRDRDGRRFDNRGIDDRSGYVSPDYRTPRGY
jgi:osmotically inducible lipoprotein OsmB